MRVRTTKRNIAVATLCLATALFPFRASADTESEIRLLKKRLLQLEAEVAKQKREARAAREAQAQAQEQQAGQGQQTSNVANAAGSATPEPRLAHHTTFMGGAGRTANVPHAHEGAPPPPPVFVSFRNGLFVETEDKQWSFKIGGRILMDGGGISQPLNGFSNQASFRQVRLEVEGKAAGIYFYKLQYDFAGTAQTVANNGNHVLAGIRDAFWGIQSPIFSIPGVKDPAYLMVGSMFEPYSLEQINTSKYRDFIERSAAVDTFAPSRHLGFAAGAYGDNWSTKAGIFTTSFEDANPNPAQGVPASWGLPHYYVPNAANLGTFGNPGATWWRSTGGSQYFDVTGRLTYAPIKDEHNLLHFGISGRYHNPGSSTGFNDDRVLLLGSRVRSEANVLGQALVGTPDLSCGTLTGPLTGPTSDTAPGGIFSNSAFAGQCVKNVESFNAEIAASHGAFGLQAEYFGALYNRDQNKLNMATWLTSAQAASGVIPMTGQAIPFVPGGRSAYFDGYYVQGTWWMTGEERASAYDHRDKNGAAFGQLKIKNPVSLGGIGAWGLAARYSSINLNNGPYSGANLQNLMALTTNAAPNPWLRTYFANRGIAGGAYQATTLGLNWYPDVGFALQANWVHVLNVAAPLNGVPNQAYTSGSHPDLFEMRAKVYW